MTWDIRSADFLIDVAAGKIPGVSAINKFGQNDDVDTGTVPETVWNGPTARWVPPTAARIHQIASTDNTADNSGGTGALTVVVMGLDENWVEQQEVVTLNGTTDVPTVNAYTRIFRLGVATAGSGKTNAGTITATADTDATVTAQIAVGDSSSQMAVWTVPAGKTALIVTAFGAVHRQGAGSKGAMVEIALHVTTGLNAANPVEVNAQTFALGVDGTSGINYSYRLPKRVDGPADIEVVVPYVSDSDLVVSAGFDAIYGDFTHA